MTSRTGRMSTWLPGRNATAPPRSTAKPPLTRPKIVPCDLGGVLERLLELVPALLAARLVAAAATPRRCGSRSARRRPRPDRRPATSAGCPGVENSLSGTRPSALSPTSTTASSFSIAMTVPVITEPSIRSLARNDFVEHARRSLRSADVGSVAIWAWVMNSVLAGQPLRAASRRRRARGIGLDEGSNDRGAAGRRSASAMRWRRRRKRARSRTRRRYPARSCRSRTRHCAGTKGATARDRSRASRSCMSCQNLAHI